MSRVVGVQFKRLHQGAILPRQATPGAAGFDLTSIGTERKPGQIIVSTGLAVAFPDDHVMLIYGRSGLAFKHGVFLTNGVGVIDADYRGEIKLAFSSTTKMLFEMEALLEAGNRVAQAIIQPIPRTVWVESYELPQTIRGEGGFGSTG